MSSNSKTGRKRDAIWAEFEEKDNRAKCRRCNFECAKLVARMKKHSETHEESDATANGEASTSTPGVVQLQQKISSFITSTSSSQRKRLDYSIGKFFFSANIPFRVVENQQFKVSTHIDSIMYVYVCIVSLIINHQ